MITVIGRGEVGRVLERCALAAGEEVRVVVRDEDPAARALERGPIAVCVREDDLAVVADALRSLSLRAAFLQNGWIEEVLEPLGEGTRGLLWFTAKGELFEVLAPSIFHGPHAEELARIFDAGGIAARVITDEEQFVREMATKLAWNNVVGLPLAVKELSLREYLATQLEEARAIVEETCAAVAAETGVGIDARAAFAVLLETTKRIGGVRGSRKAVEFRNGAVVRLARAQGRAAPVNSRLVAAAKVVRSPINL